MNPHGEKIKQFGDRVLAGDPIEEIVRYRCNTTYIWNEVRAPAWSDDKEYRVALGRCEGKPVFAGDTLYQNGNTFTMHEEFRNHDFDKYKYSWNQPKPKTLTVTIPLEYAVRIVYCYENGNYDSILAKLISAIKEEMNK